MPPRRNTSRPRSYGRQGQGKTIKSISMSASLAEWLEGQAAASGIGVSALIEQIAQQHREDAMLNDAPATEALPPITNGIRYNAPKKKAG